MTESFTESAPGRIVEVVTRGDGIARCYPERSAQALANLLENAIRHMATDSVIQVLSDGSRSSYVELVVTNQGAPIPEAMLPRVFDPFVHGVGETMRERMGLGQYIVREEMRAHGGIASVKSDSAGTTFTLRVPRLAAAALPQA